MNIFYLDHDVYKCAEMHNDKHTVINELVGGWFDCVNDWEMGVTAYVHDEGLLIDLPT